MCPMPRGQLYTLEGRIFEGSGGLLTLRVDGGGTWQLDGPRGMDRLVGKRVMVRGTRCGFDMIDVDYFAVTGLLGNGD